MRQELEILLTEREVATHYRMEPQALRNARYRGEGIPWIKTPTGGIRYRLRDIIEWDKHPCGFTFEAFSKLIAKLTVIDQQQKKMLLAAVDAAFRPQKVATREQHQER